MPIILKSNEYWGRAGGTISPVDGPIFKIRRPGMKAGGNSGPMGKRRRRWYHGRVGAKKKSHRNMG